MHSKESYLLQDVSIVVLSIFIALFITKTDLLSGLLSSATGFQFLGSFVAGMFFTSIFTTAPAIVTLGEISQSSSVLAVAFFGALGSVTGDIIIFKFIRDKLADHFMELVQHKGSFKRLKALFRLKYFRWLTFLIGGIIIASPFPDELGISLLGFSKMKTSLFVIISFIFNFIGILIIGSIATSL
ncbi:MAG: hypothetical protein ABL917_00090 [Parcubacteria group bacterium]